MEHTLIHANNFDHSSNLEMSDDGNFDHNNNTTLPTPEIRILCHPNGSVKEFTVVMSSPEQSFGIPKSNSQNKLSRNRLDSGYEEENPLISSGTPTDGKAFKDNLDETEKKGKKQNQKLRAYVDCLNGLQSTYTSKEQESKKLQTIVEKSSKEKEMKKKQEKVLPDSLVFFDSVGCTACCFNTCPLVY